MRLAWTVLCIGLFSTIPLTRIEVETTCHYRIEYQPDPTPGAWNISLEVCGLPREEGSLTLLLENWGEWTEVEEYVTELEGAPSIQRIADTERFELVQPENWNGRFKLRYTIPIAKHGSDRQQRHGLLPWRLGDTVAGFAHNTLMRVLREDEPIDANIRIDLVAPAEMAVFTGWEGLGKGLQHVKLNHGIDQCPILFGRKFSVATAREEGQIYEVVQFGRAKDITQDVLDLARPFVNAVTKSLDAPFGKPVRIFITGERPGGGGIRTDHALGLGFNPNLDFYYRILIAHEIHHEWLPGKVRGGQSIVWFFEGFNDYLALWHLAKAELISRDEFADRLRELDAEARDSKAFGQASFDDSGVRWRDGDGPRETLAYKGGATLAFLMDAELRRRGKGSVVELLRDLIPKGRYSLDLLRSWLEERDAGDLWINLVTGAEPWPDLEPVLWRHGFSSELKVTPTRLTYLGIQTDQYTMPSKVVAIDPAGPAANTPLKVGDRIVGCSPLRGGTFRVSDTAKTRYRFGMVWLDPTAQAFNIRIERDGKTRTFPIKPIIRDGAFQEERTSDPKRVDRFFR